MMIIMQFAFQIILLAVGFGVGYWLIITANTQQDTMKTFGQALGGILIVMALILEIFSAYYSMKISNRGYMQSGCPTSRNENLTRNKYRIENNDDMDEINDHKQDTSTNYYSEENAYLESKSRPIRRNKNDRD